MARVVVTRQAQEDLDRMIRTLSLAGDARARMSRSLAPFAQFPRLGVALTGAWEGFRVMLGPWRWMLIVYALLDDDAVAVVSVEDARSSTWARP